MAILKSIQSGNFTDSSTWVVVDSGSYLYQTSLGIAVSLSIMEGSNFTVSSNITISGVMLQIAGVSQNPTGNFIVRFHNVTTTTDLKTVTVNASDIPTNQSGSAGSRNVGWTYFKFDSPITLNSAQTYRLRISASSGTNIIAVMGAAGNTFDRALVTTTNGAPASSDTLIINGENISGGVFNRITVIMNNTSSAIIYGQTFVDVYGTLIWNNSASSTFHLRVGNNVFVRGGAELIIGDSINPIPSSTTCSLEISSSSPGQFQILLGSTGKIITSGENIGVYKTSISVDITAGATSFTTSVPTGWISGDRIVISGTSRGSNQSELVTVSSSSGTTVNIAGTFSFPHLGTGDIKADVGKLNRNVKIFSTSVTNWFSGINLQSSLSSVILDNTEFYDAGNDQAIPSIVGTNFSGLVTVTNSSIYSTTNRNIQFIRYGNSSYKVNLIENNIFYNSTNRVLDGSTLTLNLNTPISICNNLFINTGGAAFPINGNFNDNVICGRNNSSPLIIFNNFSGTLDNIKIYGMSSGIEFNTGVSVNFSAVTGGNIINNARIFRNNGPAVLFSTTNSISTQIPIIFEGGHFFGNSTSTLQVTGFSNINTIFKNCSFWGGTTEVTPTLISRNSNVYGQTMNRLFFDNCRFGMDYNGNISNFSSAILPLNGAQNGYFNNCLFSGTEASTPGFPLERFIGYVSTNHNGVTGAIRTFKSSCILVKDTTITDSGNPTIRIIPQSTSFNAVSDIYRIPVKAGNLVTVSINIRKSASPDTAYVGSQPQLIYLYNPASGNQTNTIAATCSSVNGVWETLNYTTPSILTDTVLEFYILCNGSSGFINISSFKTNVSNNSKSNEYFGVSGTYIEPDFRYPGINTTFTF
jgi:hypothetical protein